MRLEKWEELNSSVKGAMAIRAIRDRKLTEIEKDNSRTPAWKKEQSQKIQAQAAKELLEARQYFQSELSRLKAQAFYESFGLRARQGDLASRERQMMSIRDAFGRVENLDKLEDAARLQQQSLITDDEHLSAVIALKGYRMGWKGIVENHFAQYQQRRVAFEEWHQLDELENDPNNRLEISAAFMGAESASTIARFGSAEGAKA